MNHLFLFEEYSQNFSDLNDLRKYLISFNLPIEKWGIGGSKTIIHLLDEIRTGECTLTEEEGNLIRKIEYVACEVFYDDGEKTLKLIEEKQVFSGGRTRIREKNSSMSEKMKPDENPLDSLIRGMKEELGIEVNENQITSESTESKEEFSGSFPGLLSQYKGYNFKCYLNDSQYNPNGYVEIQDDKKTYFVWKEYVN